MKKWMIVLTAAAITAACSSGGGGGDGSSSGTQPETGAVANSFTSAVLDLLGMTSETAEPVPVEQFTESAPETTEPVPVS